MAWADRDWLGGDHFNAGATLGMALRRSFVGEFNEALSVTVANGWSCRSGTSVRSRPLNQKGSGRGEVLVVRTRFVALSYWSLAFSSVLFLFSAVHLF